MIALNLLCTIIDCISVPAQTPRSCGTEQKGHGPQLRDGQVWTGGDASRIVDGVRLTLEAHRGHSVAPLYHVLIR